MSRWTIAMVMMITAGLPAVAAVPRVEDGAGADQLMMEYVGNVVNGSPTPADSRQFGNLVAVAGADSFTALTFYTEATTTATVANGPLRIVDRTGTTTIYLASAPGRFDDPETFRSGTPVQVSTLRQQVIVDTTTGLFTVVNINTITWVQERRPTSPDLGEKGKSFRSSLTGRLNSPGGSPTGWFAGYAVR